MTNTVSVTEQSPARALRDAAAAAGHLSSPAAHTKVRDTSRLTAMTQLQAACPGLSHSTLVAIVDAVA